MDRAYARLTVKTIAPELRRFSGIASTPELDRQGEMLDPAGVTFKNPLPLLWHHDMRQVIGSVTLTATPEAILFEATLPAIAEPGPLQTRVDEAWQSVKAGMITAVSIGHRVLDGGIEWLRSGVRRVTKAEICEVSLVTVPANPSAKILSVKSLFQERPMRTASDHVHALTEKRTALATQLETVLAAAGTDPLTAEAEATVADLKLSIKQTDTQTEHWRELETVQRKAATVVPFTSAIVTPQVAPGTAFVRYVCAKLGAKMEGIEPATYAARRTDWSNTPEVLLALKAAVAPGTATDAVWAGPLVNQNISKDFLELLRAATIVDKITGLYTVPFNTKIPQQTGGGTYNWVGELKPKPVTSLTFGSVALDWAKVAGIIVLTQELIRLSSPKAEDVVRREMVAGIARFIDGQFINPAVAAVAGINPASITNGAPTAAATTNPLADILGLIQHFVNNNISVEGVTFLMSPTNALALSFKTNTDGSPVFPGIGINGGSYRGLNFITSQTVGNLVIALQPSLILYADDGGVTIDASGEASLQMDSAPDSPVAATTVYVSMFQMNTVALRAERFVNWKKANANAVKYLTAAAYPAPAGLETPAP